MQDHTDSKWLLLAPIHLEKGRQMEDKLKVLLQQGFARILFDNEIVSIIKIMNNIKLSTEEEFKKVIQYMKDNIIYKSQLCHKNFCQ